MLRLDDIENDVVSLEVYECTCGFHLAVDATYLEQVGTIIDIPCPSCATPFVIDGAEDEDDEDA